MNKKSQFSFNILHFILRILILIIVVFSVLYLVYSNVKREFDIFNTESDIVVQAVIYNPNGIFLFDKEINRLYPGIVDLAKFNQEYLDKNFNKALYFGDENRHVGIKFTLKDFYGKSANSITYNKRWYDQWEPLAKTGYPGPGGAKIKSNQFFVLVKNNNEQKIKEIENQIKLLGSDSWAVKTIIPDLKKQIQEFKKNSELEKGVLIVDVIIPNT